MAGYFELKKSKNDKIYWNLKAGNHEVILKSEMYESMAAAKNGIESVQKNSQDAARFDKLVSTSGKPFFNLKAGNGQVIGNSELYESEASRDNGIASVMTNGSSTDVKDKTDEA